MNTPNDNASRPCFSFYLSLTSRIPALFLGKYISERIVEVARPDRSTRRRTFEWLCLWVRELTRSPQDGTWETVGQTEAARSGSRRSLAWNTLVFVKRSQVPVGGCIQSQSRPPAAFTLCSMSFKRKRTTTHKPIEQRQQREVPSKMWPIHLFVASVLLLRRRVAGDQFDDANNISVGR